MLALYGVVAGWFFTVAAVVAGFAFLQEPTLRPEQPIEFPHHVHVSQLGMECDTCHHYVEQSIHAGLPPAELCMECHAGVAVDRPETGRSNGCACIA